MRAPLHNEATPTLLLEIKYSLTMKSLSACMARHGKGISGNGFIHRCMGRAMTREQMMHTNPPSVTLQFWVLNSVTTHIFISFAIETLISLPGWDIVRTRKVYFGLQFEDATHHGKKGTVIGTYDNWSHCIYSQEESEAYLSGFLLLMQSELLVHRLVLP